MTEVGSAIERAVAAVGPERFLGSLTTQEQQTLAAAAAWHMADIPRLGIARIELAAAPGLHRNQVDAQLIRYGGVGPLLLP